VSIRQAVVQGRVQGVGFRAYVRDLARSFDVTGEVWNRLDGAVVVEFQHESEDVLDSFAGALEQGPGRVDSVCVMKLAQDRERVGFSVGPTRP